MKIRVLVNGAFGRMGQYVTKAISEHPQLQLAGQTGREYNLKQAIKDSRAEVVVDFTHPDSVYQNVLDIIEVGAHPVIGTTGLKPEQIKDLQKRSAKVGLGGIIAPNFSLGCVLIMKYAKEMAKHIPNVEVIEMHHEAKADSPSGTALRVTEMMSETITNPNALIAKNHDTIPGSRGASLHGIPIHAIRLPGMLAHLQVLFGNPGETVTLRHDTIDRQCFMPGVCLACVTVPKLERLVYGLEEIL